MDFMFWIAFNGHDLQSSNSWARSLWEKEVEHMDSAFPFDMTFWATGSMEFPVGMVLTSPRACLAHFLACLPENRLYDHSSQA